MKNDTVTHLVSDRSGRFLISAGRRNLPVLSGGRADQGGAF